MSVRLSASMYQSSTHRTGFREIGYWRKMGGGAFKKICRESQGLVKIGAETLGTLYEDPSMFYCYRRHRFCLNTFCSARYLNMLTVTARSVYTECVVRFPLQQRLHERATMLHYAYIASLVETHACSPLRPGFHSSLDRMRFCGGRSGTGAGNCQSTSAFLWQYHSAIVACSSSSTRCSHQKDKQTIPGSLQVQ